MSIVVWIVFNVVVLGLLLLDLLVFHRKDSVIRVRTAFLWSLFWIGLAGLFNLGVWWYMGSAAAMEFLTGYLIEKSLSVDNLFVFLLIFSYFKVPQQYQHKVLFWGIAGALIMRGVFIFVGIALLERFSFMLYILGAILLLMSVKMLMQSSKEISLANNLVVRLVKKVVPMVRNYHSGNFMIKRRGKWFATPLFIVLIVVETTDVIFALDSIPAILAITQDPFIVYTSNVFAILGLRALFFALSGSLHLFHYLQYGLAIVLAFVGVKIIIKNWYHIETATSLMVVGGIIVLSVVISLMFPKKPENITETSQ